MGMLASWVQQVCFEPQMVSVSIAKGRGILALISESRRFALSQVARGDKSTLRRFASRPDDGEDPFLGVELLPPNGVDDPEAPSLPILAAAVAYLECQVMYHFDVEGDHDLFVAAVRKGAMRGGDPYVHIRNTGLKY